MADIPITVAAPGATHASQELRDVAKSTLAAAAADEKLAKASKASSDQLNKEAAAAKKLAAENKALSNATKSAIQRGSSLAGAGRAGIALSAFTGAGDMTKGQAASFAGIAIATAAFKILNTVLERSQKLAISSAEAIASETDAKRKNARTLDASALGAFKSLGEKRGQLGVIGGQEAVGQANQIAINTGTSIEDAISGMLILAKAGKEFLSPASIKAVQGAAMTGLLSVTEAARTQVEAGGGLTGRQITSESVGRNISGPEYATLKQAASSNIDLSTIRAITKNESQASNILLSNPNAAIRASAQARSETLAPGMTERIDAFAALSEKMGALEQIGKDQSMLTKIWQNLTSGEGSINVRVIRTTEENAAAAGIQ